jgi:hypothetical protein
MRKEDTFLSPGKSLCEQRKGLSKEGMKWMSNGKALLTI